MIIVARWCFYAAILLKVICLQMMFCKIAKKICTKETTNRMNSLPRANCGDDLRDIDILWKSSEDLGVLGVSHFNWRILGEFLKGDAPVWSTPRDDLSFNVARRFGRHQRRVLCQTEIDGDSIALFISEVGKGVGWGPCTGSIGVGGEALSDTGGYLESRRSMGP